MEFRIEVSQYKNTKEIQANIVNKPEDFCCDSMFDLYRQSYTESPPNTPVYGGINIFSSQENEEEGELCVELMFVFEDGMEQARLAFPIYFCPFCGKTLTVKKIQIPSLNNEERKGD